LFAYGPADATAVPKAHNLWIHLNLDWFYLNQVVQGVVVIVVVVVVVVAVVVVVLVATLVIV